jgi:hypothetical protein
MRPAAICAACRSKTRKATLASLLKADSRYTRGITNLAAREPVQRLRARPQAASAAAAVFAQQGDFRDARCQGEEAFANARRAAIAEVRRIGFDPQEIVKRLKVGMDRAVYTRTPY